MANASPFPPRAVTFLTYRLLIGGRPTPQGRGGFLTLRSNTLAENVTALRLFVGSSLVGVAVGGDLQFFDFLLELPLHVPD